MERLRIFKKEKGKIIVHEMEYTSVDFKEQYIIIYKGEKKEVVKNFENIKFLN